jgi:hypothetical protein
VRYHVPMDKIKRPPNDRGQGRKPISESDETVTVSLRMTAPLRDKLKRLGGAPWVREKVAKAKEPT